MPKTTPKKPIATRKQRIATANIADSLHGVDSSKENVNVAEEYLENPVQPEIDKNQYRVIKLSNGLTAVLISTDSLPRNRASMNDNGSGQKAPQQARDKSPKADDTQKPRVVEFWDRIAMVIGKDPSYVTCTLSMDVGSFSDPPNISGISRILSRVFLCSSIAYPQVKSFANFLMEHEGCSLKMPDHCELTYFSFKLLTAHLSSALDRFTDCFVNPILRGDSIIAERDLMKEESRRNDHMMSSPDQKDRLFNALSSGIKRYAGSAAGRCGGSQLFCITKDALLKEVNQFMKRHYSANRMKVAIQASLPLDTLEEYTRKYFGRIPNNGMPPVDLGCRSYLRFFNMSAFNMLYEMNPVPDGPNKIELNWPMPSFHGLYRSKPYLYILWLIQNEKEGSLVYFLRKKNWCSQVEAYVGKRDFESNTIYSLFTISIHLTPGGYRYQKKIIDFVYSYVNFLKLVCPNKRVYDEVRRTAEGKFRTKVRDSANLANAELCKNIHMYPSVDYLGGDILCYEYDPKAIKACLDCMSPETANLTLYGQKMPGLYWKTNTHYSDSENAELGKFMRLKIPKDWIKEWKNIAPLACFKLPPPNIFCPDDFSLLPPVKDCPKYPVKIHSDTLYEVWYKADDKFCTPECRIAVTFNSDIPLKSAETAAMFDLFSRAVARLSYDELSAAIAAGMEYAIESDETSLSVVASGFNKKLAILMDVIGNFIGCCSALVSKEFFTVIRDEQLEKYCKICTGNESLATDVKRAILFPVYWTIADRIAALPAIQFEKFQYFTANYTSRVYVKSLVQGNIGESDALEMVRSLVGLSKCGSIAPEYRPQFEMKEIPHGASWCKVRSLCPHRTPDYTISYYQFGEKSLILTAAIDILRRMMDASDFTVQKIYRSLDDVLLSARLRESCCNEYSLDTTDNHFPEYMLPEQRFENYRRSLWEFIHGTSDQFLVFVKRSLIRLKRDACPQLQAEMRCNWGEIKTGEYMFDRYRREARAIMQLDFQELRNILISLVTENPLARKLTIQIVGHMKCDEEHYENNPSNIPCPQDMKIKLLSHSSKNEDGGRHFCIRDIPSYKRPLNTIRARAPDCVDKIATDVEKSCKL